MPTMDWRVETRLRGFKGGWDRGYQPFTPKAVVKEVERLNRLLPHYEHRAVYVGPSATKGS